MQHAAKVRTRKSNFELLRVIAMIMIIAHHFAGHGIQHDLEGSTAYVIWRNGSLLNKIVDCLFAPGGKIGVGIFFMLTGYFLINKRSFSLKKIVLEGAFYGLINSIIYIILLYVGVLPMPESKVNSILIPIMLAVFNPATGGVWWFISAYVMLILLLPFFNKLLNRFTKEGYFIFLVIFWIIWYSIGSLGTPYYYVTTAIFFYSIGGFIRLFGKKIESKRRIFLIVFFIIFWVIDAYCIYLNALNISTFSRIKYLLISQVQISICWPVCAVSSFKLFESINIGSQELINKIASTTFGIYLIHEFGPFRSLIWDKIFKVDLLYASRWFPLYAFLVVIVVFIVGSAIDMVRQVLFEPKMLQTATTLINQFKIKYMR
ncbi:MAG: acyltransferase [Eubacteriaceae bacterium]|uniref:Acyltransferase n=1 Tax=Candidatus Pseudoramibacter fermentans TaxID=2594427 RepID=A0A6L5GS12_9FIRM|nr:acyltransferase [Candidatus Pseudoramibacter fermentans]RRF93601.1 MAG: acyltransferase [Eubacteriaceae bacterium]